MRESTTDLLEGYGLLRWGDDLDAVMYHFPATTIDRRVARNPKTGEPIPLVPQVTIPDIVDPVTGRSFAVALRFDDASNMRDLSGIGLCLFDVDADAEADEDDDVICEELTAARDAAVRLASALGFDEELEARCADALVLDELEPQEWVIEPPGQDPLRVFIADGWLYFAVERESERAFKAMVEALRAYVEGRR
jgi:hypothetical protein